MFDPALQLSGTGQAYAPVNRLVLDPNHIGFANGTRIRDMKLPLCPGPPGLHHLHDLRNDVSRPLDDHRIAYPNILLIDLILVVQGRPADLDTSYPNGI